MDYKKLVKGAEKNAPMYALNEWRYVSWIDSILTCDAVVKSVSYPQDEDLLKAQIATDIRELKDPLSGEDVVPDNISVTLIDECRKLLPSDKLFIGKYKKLWLRYYASAILREVKVVIISSHIEECA